MNNFCQFLYICYNKEKTPLLNIWMISTYINKEQIVIARFLNLMLIQIKVIY